MICRENCYLFLKICGIEYELDIYNNNLLLRNDEVFFPRQYTYNLNFRMIIYKIKELVIPLLIISSVFLSFLFFVYFFILKFLRRKNKISLQESKLFINWSSDRNLKFIDEINSKFAVIKPLKIRFSKKGYCLIDYISLNDILVGFIDYIKILKIFINTRSVYKIPFTYTIFLPELILSAKSLKKIKNKTILVSNHYDRWIYIVDYFTSNVKLVNVEHGDPLGRKQDGTTYEFRPSMKLQQRWVIYCQNKVSADVLSLIRVKKPDVKYFYPKFTIINDIKVDLVILGNKRLHDLFIKLYKESSKLGLKTLYRPHPLEKKIPYPLMSILDIANGNNLTKTKLLLSYGSSLDFAYKNYACDEIIYIRDDGSNISELINYIRRVY